jgi:hypothetical protein
MFSGDVGIHMLFIVGFVVIVLAVVMAGVLGWRWVNHQSTCLPPRRVGGRADRR